MKYSYLKIRNLLPYVGKLARDRDQLLKERNELLEKISNNNFGKFPPGHYYSPIPSVQDIKTIFKLKHTSEEILAINLNVKKQLRILETFYQYNKDLPWHDEKIKNLRYFGIYIFN